MGLAEPVTKWRFRDATAYKIGIVISTLPTALTAGLVYSIWRNPEVKPYATAIFFASGIVALWLGLRIISQIDIRTRRFADSWSAFFSAAMRVHVLVTAALFLALVAYVGYEHFTTVDSYSTGEAVGTFAALLPGIAISTLFISLMVLVVFTLPTALLTSASVASLVLEDV